MMPPREGAADAAPWQAPPPAKRYRIGYLESAAERFNRDTFVQGLRELGYVEGQNLIVEERFATRSPDELPQLVAELVRLDVDALVAISTVAALAAKSATSTIPIVAISGDAVGSGLVGSLARPGGNVTGITLLSPELSGKRLELLRAATPDASRVGVLWYPEEPAPAAALRETESAAGLMGITLQPLPVRRGDDLPGAFEAATGGSSGALLVLQAPPIGGNLVQVVELAAYYGLPTMYSARGYVAAGGLMSYGPQQAVHFRRAAYYVDRILMGAKPADLPVEQPITFEFVVNLKTAQALGIIFPNEILLQVTEVLQ
jgi:putative tryptophan/tyrosine transport system substrate-binding protein